MSIVFAKQKVTKKLVARIPRSNRDATLLALEALAA